MNYCREKIKKENEQTRKKLIYCRTRGTTRPTVVNIFQNIESMKYNYWYTRHIYIYCLSFDCVWFCVKVVN